MTHANLLWSFSSIRVPRTCLLTNVLDGCRITWLSHFDARLSSTILETQQTGGSSRRRPDRLRGSSRGGMTSYWASARTRVRRTSSRLSSANMANGQVYFVILQCNVSPCSLHSSFFFIPVDRIYDGLGLPSRVRTRLSCPFLSFIILIYHLLFFCEGCVRMLRTQIRLRNWTWRCLRRRRRGHHHLRLRHRGDASLG